MILKSFLKRFSCFSNGTVLFRRSFRTVTVAAVLLYGGYADAVPLDNWRLPFFSIAADYEAADGSPSLMFWDNTDRAILFDTSLWVRTDDSTGKWWYVEPTVAGGVKGSRDVTSFYYFGDLYSEVRYANLRIVQNLDVDSRFKDDPNYPAHRDRAFQGRIGEAWLDITWRHGLVSLGRKARSWGPFPDRSLLLSANPYSYDAVELQFTNKFFEFRHLFAPFASKRAKRDSDNGSTRDRYLTAHSLNVMFGKWVTLGISETVLFTRDESFPDLQYLNPVSIYTVTNTNQEGDGNLMLGFQWNAHPGIENLSCRGQIVIDDIQVDDKKVTDQEPNHWALDAGIFWCEPLSFLHRRHCITIEYQYASQWLYTVPDNNARNGERYMFIRKSLGLPFSDGSRLRLTMSAVPLDYAAVNLFASYRRSGGNTVLTRWNDSDSIRGLPVSVERPIERRSAIGLEGLIHYRNYITAVITGDLGWIKNKNNVHTDAFAFDPFFSIEATLHFCGARKVLQ